MTQMVELRSKDLKQKKNMSEDMETLHRMQTIGWERWRGKESNGKCRTEKIQNLK